MEFMDLLNVAIVVLFFVFLVIQGYQSVKRLKAHLEATKECTEKRKNVVVCKDYMLWVIIYLVMGVVMVFYGVYFYGPSQFLYFSLFLVLAAFTIVFCMDSMVAKTVVFYDTGFLYNGEHKKYRSILKIGEKKKFAKGYTVRLTNDESVLLTKKAKELLEVKIAEYKATKKERQ